MGGGGGGREEGREREGGGREGEIEVGGGGGGERLDEDTGFVNLFSFSLVSVTTRNVPCPFQPDSTCFITSFSS